MWFDVVVFVGECSFVVGWEKVVLVVVWYVGVVVVVRYGFGECVGLC